MIYLLGGLAVFFGFVIWLFFRKRNNLKKTRSISESGAISAGKTPDPNLSDQIDESTDLPEMVTTETEPIVPVKEVDLPISENYPIFLHSTHALRPNFNYIERNDKGVLEDYFFDYLKRSFKSKIHNNIKLSGSNYIPDFVYVDKINNLVIDIEIDEPYTLTLKNEFEPTHYKGTDRARDTHFLQNGWHVIRFAEEQIARYPEKCIEQIEACIETMSNSPVLPQIKCWHYSEAREMIDTKFREEYLPIHFILNIRNPDSPFRYRSFEIQHWAEKESKKAIKYAVVRFRKNEILDENGDIIDEHEEPTECWIPFHSFITVLSKSAFGEMLKKYEMTNLNKIMMIDMKFKFEALGSVNGYYFNVLDNNCFNIITSPVILTQLESQCKLLQSKIKNSDPFYAKS